ncbi:ParB/RepB/Spo0J family partition protein [Sphingopyxis sp. JAI128]|uniref:ParB/RepB/Spo0J family partition protein n=1 Tax=Sphingopyxis sp. JAI128 TaxID=2723066 RepID=UPI001610A26F|nr:ParB/RepB/Spo0J family partition protein [Sphingopyxis sp. JAI128]MBB6425109.1 ParB family chromosome partitioning protein [Sphingopyxis sp. JAI128]
MELKHIDIANLSVSSANMRGVTKKPDLTNILPSIRARGILVPLIVRPGAEDGSYEIVAGKRRYHAGLAVAEEQDGIDPLPCAVMEAGDDAAALEASLIENIARLDPDEVNRCEAFTRLVREGRSIEAVGLTFGLTSLQVKRTLAIGNLLPRIRNLYRAEKIEAVTMRHLTLASKAQQREWLALVDCPEKHAPTGPQLKAWLFGGSAIAAKVAMFDLADYTGDVISDLFGEDRYFASADDFWTAQMVAVDDRADAYREAGWSEVVIMDRGSYFNSWEHDHCPKKKGGKVFVSVSHRGEVAFHEGYITMKEARQRAKGEPGADTPKPVRPEVSAALGNYIDLHRHAAVRASVLSEPGVALRLMVAHAIVGSPLWRVDVERQRAASDAIAESVEVSASEAAFDAKRREVLATLGFDPETPTVVGGYDGDHGVAGLFVRLLALSDDAVMSILPIVMGETLAVGSAAQSSALIRLGAWAPNFWGCIGGIFMRILGASVLRKFCAALLVFLDATIMVPSASAQVANEPTPYRNVDEFGVDVSTGTFNFSMVDVAGNPGSTGLSYARTWTRAGWKDNYSGSLYQDGSFISITRGGVSESFTLSGSTWVSAKGNGATLVRTFVGGFPVYTYTSSDGTVTV